MEIPSELKQELLDVLQKVETVLRTDQKLRSQDSLIIKLDGDDIRKICFDTVTNQIVDCEDI